MKGEEEGKEGVQSANAIFRSTYVCLLFYYKHIPGMTVNCCSISITTASRSKWVICMCPSFSFERTIYAVSNPKGTYGNTGYSFR
jgi:hypothetical protein